MILNDTANNVYLIIITRRTLYEYGTKGDSNLKWALNIMPNVILHLKLFKTFLVNVWRMISESPMYLLL